MTWLSVRTRSPSHDAGHFGLYCRYWWLARECIMHVTWMDYSSTSHWNINTRGSPGMPCLFQQPRKLVGTSHSATWWIYLNYVWSLPNIVVVGVKNRLIPSIIWDITRQVVPLRLVYHAPSYERSTSWVAPISSDLVYSSMLFILELACAVWTLVRKTCLRSQMS